MKKSKIIVPALGILAFSTAAAVTGTVAWFTASRQATVKNSAITAFNPETGLQVKLGGTDGSDHTAGVTLTTPGETSIVEASHKLFRDGSVDLSEQTVWGSNLGADGQLDGTNPYKKSTHADYEAGTKADNTTKYYYATKYKATFSLTAAAASSDQYALVFDIANSTFTNSDNIKIAPALRIGIRISETSYFVINPFRDEIGYGYTRDTTVTSENWGTKKDNLYTESSGTYTKVANDAEFAAGTKYYTRNTINSENYVTGVNTTASYNSKVVYHGSNNMSGIGGSATSAAVSAKLGYMGTISGSASIDTYVYTWFEGCDPACVNGNDDSAHNLAADLSFRLVKIVAA